MKHLFDLFSNEQPSEIHENVAAIWVEFVKALRESQFSCINNLDEKTTTRMDSLLESIQSQEMIQNLLTVMFPTDKAQQSISVGYLNFFF